MPNLRPIQVICCVSLLCGYAGRSDTLAADPEQLGRVAFEGEILEDRDLSGAAIRGDLLVIGSDERSAVQILRREAADRYRVVSQVQLLADPRAEADIEAIAIAGDWVYVAGSHSRVRKKVEYPDDSDQRTYEKNRERLAEVSVEPSRDRIFRFQLGPDGTRRSAVEAINLRPVLEANPILAPFTAIPGKEGGIDIEGLAADGDLLYVGFRGPVLRQNYVPVLMLRFGQPQVSRLLFVNLGGHGIRDLLKVDQGLLVLSGPMGDRTEEGEIYLWDGQDCVPGSDRRPAGLVTLGSVPTPKGGKAEAIALVEETAEAWTVLVLYDSEKQGKPQKLRIEKP